MQLVFVFAIVLIQVFCVHFGKIVEIIRAFGIHTFMYAEKLTVFLGGKGIAAVRAGKAERCCDSFAGGKGLAADFALVLAFTAIVIVDEMMWGTA